MIFRYSGYTTSLPGSIVGNKGELPQYSSIANEERFHQAIRHCDRYQGQQGSQCQPCWSMGSYELCHSSSSAVCLSLDSREVRHPIQHVPLYSDEGGGKLF
jgi:hypothetical protein